MILNLITFFYIFEFLKAVVKMNATALLKFRCMELNLLVFIINYLLKIYYSA